MLCPKCQSTPLVIEKRSPDAANTNDNPHPMIEKGLHLFGWWTDEFEMSKRECLDCKHQFETMEVSIDDLRDALAEVIREVVLSPFMINEHFVTEE